MHKVSRVVTKDISLVDVRLGRLHSCLQSWISIRMYCDAHRKRHVLPLCQTMQVGDTHQQRFDVEMKTTPGFRLPMPPQKRAHTSMLACQIAVHNLTWKIKWFGTHPNLFTDTAVFIALAFEVVPERDLRVDEEQEATFLVFLEGFADKSADAQHSWDMYWKASQPSASSACPSSILTPASSSLTWTFSTLTFTLPSSRRVGCPFQAER